MIKSLELINRENYKERDAIVDFLEKSGAICILTGSISIGLGVSSSDLDIICFSDHDAQKIEAICNNKFLRKLDIQVYASVDEFLQDAYRVGYVLGKLWDATPINLSKDDAQKIENARLNCDKVLTGKLFLLNTIVAKRYKIPSRYRRNDYGDDKKYYFGGVNRVKSLLTVGKYLDPSAEDTISKLEVVAKEFGLDSKNLLFAVTLVYNLYSFMSKYADGDFRTSINQLTLAQFYQSECIDQYNTFEEFEIEFYKARSLVEDITELSFNLIRLDLSLIDPDYISLIQTCQSSAELDRLIIQEVSGNRNWYNLMLLSVYTEKMKPLTVKFVYHKVSHYPELRIVKAILSKYAI